MYSKNRLKILRFEPCRALGSGLMVNIQGVCPFPHCTVRIVSSKYCHCVHLDELDLCTKETIQKYSNLSPVEPQEDQ